MNWFFLWLMGQKSTRTLVICQKELTVTSDSHSEKNMDPDAKRRSITDPDPKTLVSSVQSS